MTGHLDRNSAGQWLCPTCGEPFETAAEAIECDRWDRQQLSVSRYEREQIAAAAQQTES